MKKEILPVLLLFTLFTKAQTMEFVGKYNISETYNLTKGLEYTLSINSDKTFSFHMLKNLKGMLKEENSYAKGTWTSKNNYIYFHSTKSDFDNTYTLDFNNSKAVFKTKHPRDKSNRIITPHLIFLESNISWMKRLKMDKK